MLNGKFYTGLPPNMINRSNSLVKDRMQTQFFWPDDTDTESAVETRVRRRASLSLTPSERPIVKQRSPMLSSTESADEMDTKQRLHKEFAKSSIQFFDNITEEDENPRQRQSYLKNAAKHEITSKPTATKLELPNIETDTAAFKNKQLHESKILFYDYIDEDLKSQNNGTRNAKIDMNDKKEMERNAKNSPKLQMKSNVNNYMIDTQDNKFQEQYKKPTNQLRAASEFPEDRSYESLNEEDKLRNSRAKSLEGRRRNNIYRRDQTPKRILKNSVRNGIDYSNYPECVDDDDDDELFNGTADYVTETMKHVQINGRRAPPRKHVSYSEEEEEIPLQKFYNNNNNKNNNNDDEGDLYYRKQSNQSKYSNAHSARYNKAGNNRRPQYERSNSTDGEQTELDNYQYMETSKTNNQLRPLNNKQNSKFNNATQELMESSTVRANNNRSMPTENNSNHNNSNNNNKIANSSHKHLLSSLCFHGGEIIASDNEAATSTTHQRRNARNAAATKRVSVGLPD